MYSISSNRGFSKILEMLIIIILNFSCFLLSYSDFSNQSGHFFDLNYFSLISTLYIFNVLARKLDSKQNCIFLFVILINALELKGYFGSTFVYLINILALSATFVIDVKLRKSELNISNAICSLIYSFYIALFLKELYSIEHSGYIYLIVCIGILHFIGPKNLLSIFSIYSILCFAFSNAFFLLVPGIILFRRYLNHYVVKFNYDIDKFLGGAVLFFAFIFMKQSNYGVTINGLVALLSFLFFATIPHWPELKEESYHE